MKKLAIAALVLLAAAVGASWNSHPHAASWNSKHNHGPSA